MSDAIVISGTVTDFGDLYEKGDFKKRDLIVKTDGEYPQVYAVEFVKEKEELLDFLEIGQRVQVHCNLRGREWVNPSGVTKYFISLQGWKIDK